MSYLNRGLAYYYYLDQHPRAIQDYNKAIQLDSDDAKAYNNRGFAYHNLGQDAEAYADKAKACSLDSQYCSKPPPTRTPTPITLPLTATPCPQCDVANLVWPSVHTFRPKTGMADDITEVEGNGGYYYFDGAYDESARSSDLYFGGKKAGSIVCYVNGCFGSFNVPIGTPPGLYEVKSKGGPPSDIKPQNILLKEDGSVAVSDFGIARALASSTRSRTAGVMGTPAYMSPKQWASGNLDGRLDQYALGIVLYEMLAGSALPG